MDSRVLFLAGLLLTGCVPSCYARYSDDDSWFTLKNIAIGGVVGAGAVVAAPFALGAAGFGAAGVTAGSLAAAIQGSAVASGSAFALGQSAGAAGLGIGAKVAVFVGGFATGTVASNKFDD
ncbi:interferon alpha-inducible protein 27-like protein 2B [Mya arenaria]|uniref:interferon alpha-inducible protein 27-like protein 2B n=1 Tax=Mya arenaria TaxID=6604 RepID=UPI0022E0398D|nr:interferon alpha-inducible protein 27-like protein 2B [Mya arenaria]XP_052763826.1 interferon alpha-inducible protein 27-like protein 2B [Mya arenaria]XP_052763827.1 interferon alpha-inducible protein 27-like protein 2B [Mya arenaria]XP_052763828.1 interferon alpha-inducible protein 27-like protein 2B [Mya arenaria]